MSFIIFHRDSTITHRNRRTRREHWETVISAKGEITRSKLDKEVWLIEEYDHFKKKIEKTEVVYSIHDLKREKPITQSVNTPLCCDPSSETYWSM